MATTITIPDKIVPKIWEAAQREGYKKADDFVLHLIEEKLLEIADRMKLIEITDRVRDGLVLKDISENEILEDFERFRERIKDE
jgi:hypothetical protein